MKYFYIVYIWKGAMGEIKLTSMASIFPSEEIMFSHLLELGKTKNDLILLDWKELTESQFIKVKKLEKTMEIK